METFLKTIADSNFYLSLLYPLLYLKGFVVNNKAFKLFTIYLLAIGIVQLFARLVIKAFEMDSNLFLSHFYFILQFILLSLFYAELLKYKRIYYVLGLVLAFLTYQYVEDPSVYFRYNTIGMCSTQIIVVVYTLIYMFQSLSVKKQFTLVNVGLFIYLLSSSLIFACGNLIFNNDVPEYFSDLLININRFLYLAFQILIIVEWYRNYRKQKNYSRSLSNY